MSILTPIEVLIAAQRLTRARPHLAAVAGIVRQDDLWQLYRDEFAGVDVRVDGWDIRGPLVRRSRRGHAAAREVATWTGDPVDVIAAQMAPRERHGSYRPERGEDYLRSTVGRHLN